MSKEDIVTRGNRVEAQMCDLFGITPDEYLVMWYESGCEYAERLFKEWALTGKSHRRAVDIYIKSTVFWYFWAKLWLNSCEKFIERGFTSRKGFEIFIKNQPQPDKGIHRQIVSASKAKSKKATKEFHENY